MNKELTGKEILLRLVESLNKSNSVYSYEVIEAAILQYEELRRLKIFNRYPKIGDSK